MNDITVRVSFIVRSIFRDINGNFYSTDDWDEENIEIEVPKNDVNLIIDTMMSTATNLVRYLILECKNYHLIERCDPAGIKDNNNDDIKDIEGLHLLRIEVSKLRYELMNDLGKTIDVPGYHGLAFPR